MLGLRLALGAIALMGMLTAGAGALAVINYERPPAVARFDLRVPGSDPYWRALVAGAMDAADKAGVELAVTARRGGERDGEAVLTSLQGRMEGTCGLLSRPDFGDFHIGLANYRSGKECAYLVGRLPAPLASAPAKCVAIVFAGNETQSTSARLQGFQDELARMCRAEGDARPAWRVVVERIDDQDRRALADRLASINAAHPDAAAVVDFTGLPSTPLAEQFCQRARRPQLITFDHREEAMSLLETGEIDAVISHDPYECGRAAVERLRRWQDAEAVALPAPGKAFVSQTPIVVQSGNVAEIRSRMKPFASMQPRS